MISNDPIAQAKALSAGAVFHRCALQVNPHHYRSTFRGQPVLRDAGAHERAIIEKASQIGVSVIAITDHNNVTGIPAFQSAASDHGIHVFPG
ncbi:MAG TPA: PHP domain-containing protein, partial [Sumerlaeia bacterium]|nr:PHP domain-containing protein [Sumerlaeia bacterium]